MKIATELNADLHSHSIVSDGTLSPRDLVGRAAANGVELYALTDHDETGGLAAAAACARDLDLPFVSGIEISVTWAGHTVHVVGLGIDAEDRTLCDGVARLRFGRRARARQMADGLARAGIDGTYDGALKYVGNPELISRTHFARYLVERGVCRDTREVFSRFLVEDKPGYVPHDWARLAQAVQWIDGAGGIAVLAHPGRYKVSDTELWALLSEFRDLGGAAIEVVTGSHGVADVHRFTELALQFGFDASRGSDFHGPGESAADLGRIASLSNRLTPVWTRFT
jgi:predicted metal-dependent phosphoesterase TrpH